jgi:hypothetical protein
MDSERMLDEALSQVLTLEAAGGKGWNPLGTLVARDEMHQDWVTCLLVVWGHWPS